MPKLANPISGSLSGEQIQALQAVSKRLRQEPESVPQTRRRWDRASGRWIEEPVYEDLRTKVPGRNRQVDVLRSGIEPVQVMINPIDEANRQHRGLTGLSREQQVFRFNKARFAEILKEPGFEPVRDLFLRSLKGEAADIIPGVGSVPGDLDFSIVGGDLNPFPGPSGSKGFAISEFFAPGDDPDSDIQETVARELQQRRGDDDRTTQGFRSPRGRGRGTTILTSGAGPNILGG